MMFNLYFYYSSDKKMTFQDDTVHKVNYTTLATNVPDLDAVYQIIYAEKPNLIHVNPFKSIVIENVTMLFYALPKSKDCYVFKIEEI